MISGARATSSVLKPNCLYKEDAAPVSTLFLLFSSFLTGTEHCISISPCVARNELRAQNETKTNAAVHGFDL